jgi:hypothetical protein
MAHNTAITQVHRQFVAGDSGDAAFASGGQRRPYFLDPDRLGQVVGANYHDLKLKRFNQRVRDYVADIMRSHNIGRPA